MKIAVSASGTGPGAQVDPRFGRCTHFVLYDTELDSYQSVPNTAAGSPSGSGIQAAQGVVNAGAGVVLTGQIGPNAYRVLEAAGVKCGAGAGDTVRECIERYQAGKWDPVEGATAAPHAGMGRAPGRSAGPGPGRGGAGQGGGRARVRQGIGQGIGQGAGQGIRQGTGPGFEQGTGQGTGQGFGQGGRRPGRQGGGQGGGRGPRGAGRGGGAF